MNTTKTTHYAASSKGDALCGADWQWPVEEIAALKTDTTCPACLAKLAELLAPKTEVVHFYGTAAARAVGRMACGASGDAEGSPYRQDVTCLRCLGVAADPKQPEPAIACSLVHEHDPATCAAPSVAELTLDTVGVHLAELYARIETVFEVDTDRHFALEQVQATISDLLKLLGVPVPAPAGTE